MKIRRSKALRAGRKHGNPAADRRKRRLQLPTRHVACSFRQAAGQTLGQYHQNAMAQMTKRQHAMQSVRPVIFTIFDAMSMT